MEDRIFPGNCMKRPGDGGEILNITPVVPSEAHERANFCGILGGPYLPDGC